MSSTKHKPIRGSNTTNQDINGTFLQHAAEELKLTQGFASAVLDTIGSLVLILDRRGRIVYFNRACEKTTGYTFEEVRGKYVFDIFILPKEKEAVKNVFRELKAGQFPNSFENYWQTKDGRVRLIAWTNTAILDKRGEVKWVVPTGLDITDRRKAEEERIRMADRIRLILESTDEAIYAVDEKGLCTTFNKAASEITGYSPEEVLGKNLHKLIHHSHSDGSKYKQGQCPVVMAIKEGVGLRLDNETLWRKDGTSFLAEHSSHPIIENGVIKGAVITFADITERKKQENMLNYLAYYDALTSLPNRTLLNDRLNQSLAHAYRTKEMLAVFFIDLDNFKAINDTLGHSTGDILLQNVAERLKKCLREGDTIARLGGDEFIIVLPQISSTDDIEKVAEKVIDTLNRPFHHNKRDFYITASIGISTYPYDGKKTITLLKKADLALYRAKEHGRNNYQFYAATMNAKAHARLALENSLRKAIENKEFILFYQPMVDISSNNIVGLEALLRWQHPKLGLLSPIEFIQVAEETGLIMQIGEWALRTACKQNKQLQDEGYPQIPISVNISAYQLRKHNFIDVVTRSLKEAKLSPRYLELEITESAVMQDEVLAIETLRELKKKGINIAIDDFGTGYSSLGYLKRFPIDKLKIDRIFINKITKDASDAAITKAIIAMAHSLNLKTVAEGVETPRQLDFLRSLKCDQMQGYLFSKPLPIEEIKKLFDKAFSSCA